MISKKWLSITVVAIAAALLALGTIYARGAIDKKAGAACPDIVAFVKRDGLYAARLDNYTAKLIVSGENLEKPLISHGGGYIAFQRDARVYVTDFQGRRSDEISMLNDKNSLCWSRKDEILYIGAAGGGLLEYSAATRGKRWILQSGYHYSELACSPDGEELYYQKAHRDADGNIRILGVFSLNLASKAEKLLIKAVPASNRQDGVGLIPQIARLSDDGDWLYVFLAFDSASLTADGVPFGAYNLRIDRLFTFNNKVVTLAYSANVAPLDDGKLALLIGAGRDMLWNKSVNHLTAASGAQYSISKPSQAAAYPSASPDYKRLVYSAFDEEKIVSDDDYKSGKLYFSRRIYITDIKNPSPMALTNDEGYRDESPRFLSDGKRILFARIDANRAVSLWTVDIKSKKTVELARDLHFASEFYEYYGFVDYSLVFDLRICQ